MLHLCFIYVLIMHIPRHCRTNQPRLIVSQSSKAQLSLIHDLSIEHFEESTLHTLDFTLNAVKEFTQSQPISKTYVQ
jgi:hypothetical protein